MSAFEIWLIYCATMLVLERALKNKMKREKGEVAEEHVPSGERYTIFHALFDSLKEKEKKQRK